MQSVLVLLSEFFNFKISPQTAKSVSCGDLHKNSLGLRRSEGFLFPQPKLPLPNPKYFIPAVVIMLILVMLIVGLARGETASWYGGGEKLNVYTASGEVFDENNYTFACWHLPFKTKVEFTNIRNGKKVIAICTDRGPAKRLVRKGRIFDLSKATFAQIENLEKGVIKIKWRIVK